MRTTGASSSERLFWSGVANSVNSGAESPTPLHYRELSLSIIREYRFRPRQRLSLVR